MSVFNSMIDPPLIFSSLTTAPLRGLMYLAVKLPEALLRSTFNDVAELL